MIKKHIECNECGAITLDASFEDSIYGDYIGVFDHSHITQTGEDEELTMKGVDWTIVASRNPDDLISVTFIHLCPDCS